MSVLGGDCHRSGASGTTLLPGWGSRSATVVLSAQYCPVVTGGRLGWWAPVLQVSRFSGFQCLECFGHSPPHVRA